MIYVHTYSQSDNALLRYDHLKFSKITAGRRLGFDRTRNGAVRSDSIRHPWKPHPRTSTKSIGWRIAEIRPFEVFKLAVGCHLGFDRTGNGAVWSAVPEKPNQEPKKKGMGWRIAELWHLKFLQNVWMGPEVGRWSSIFLLLMYSSFAVPSGMSSYICHICGRVCRAKIGLMSHRSTHCYCFDRTLIIIHGQQQQHSSSVTLGT